MRIDNPTGSIASLTGSFTGSFYGDGLGLINIESASYAETASYAASASYAISSSHEIVTEVSSSYAETATSSSYALTASYALNGGSGGGGGSADYSPFTTGSSADKILPKEGSNCDVIGSNSTIAGGIQNEIGDSSSTISFIGGGCQNLIGSKQNTAGFIGGGTNNTLHCYTGTGGAIVGGTNNLLCLSAAGFIGGGSQNTIKLSDRSVIVGGSNNIIVPGTTAHYISIVGGYLNTGSCGFAGILGGCQNHVNNDHSFIIGSSLTSDKDCYTFMNNADVAGTVSASIFSGSFVGDGSGLTGISGGGVTFDYTDSATYENLILGESLTLGTYSNKNTALGYLAFANNDSSGEGTFIGYAAGRYNSAGEFSGGANTSVGYRALMGVSGQTTGCRNTAVGDDAAYIITTANNTTAIGTCALRQVSNGSGNTAVGYNSGFCTTGGVSNSFFGAGAGFGVVGDCNVYIGSYAGSDGLNEFTGDNNIVIGENADPSSLSVSNEITIGNTSINSLRIPGLQSGASDGDVLTYSSTSGDITLQTPSGGGGTIYNSTVRYVAYNSTQLVEILSTGTMYSGLSWSRSGATITITSTAHGLSNGDYVVVRNMGDTDYVYGVISSVTTDSFQITNAVSSGDTSGTAGAYIPAADATSVTDSAATIGSPTVGDIQIISIKVWFNSPFKSTSTFDLTMPTSLTNGAGGNTSTATMNPPTVLAWDLSSGAQLGAGNISVWGGAGSPQNYNVFQVGGLNTLVDGMVKFTF